ncbi:HAD family phosphatase [Candidatus Peregrinibacteria bacterium]|nr:HAD family phosphatase [Candidatus Peregrinibacteria bacterium]MBI3817008.1 HAD family phosphatase [Candidatus Peregrinibacteria bacterium]
MSYAAILFDLDGTLVDTIGLYERASLQALTSNGFTMTPEHFLEKYAAGEHLQDILAGYGKTERDAPSLRSTRDSIYEQFLETEAEWFPGAENILTFARERFPIAIVTGSWRSYVDCIDRRLHLTRFTEVIVTAEDMGMGTVMKPHPHGLLVAADRCNAPPEQCLYIGDQLFDVEAAHRGGMRCCIVRGNYTPVEAAREADFAVDSLKEVETLL